MNEDLRLQLTKHVVELTDSGADMGALPRGRDNIVHWLRESRRMDEADALSSGPDFWLNGTEDGLVRVQVAGSATQETLVDFGRARD